MSMAAPSARTHIAPYIVTTVGPALLWSLVSQIDLWIIYTTRINSIYYIITFSTIEKRIIKSCNWMRFVFWKTIHKNWNATRYYLSNQDSHLPHEHMHAEMENQMVSKPSFPMWRSSRKRKRNMVDRHSEPILPSAASTSKWLGDSHPLVPGLSKQG